MLTYLRDGSHIWINYNGKAIDPPDLSIGTHWILEDITERKQAEEALRESEEKYRTIFNNAIEGISPSTPEGRYRAINAASARIFGYESPEEMINTVTNIGEHLYVLRAISSRPGKCRD
jgi:PAS domain-containing protein